MWADTASINRLAAALALAATLMLSWGLFNWLGTNNEFAIRQVTVLHPLRQVDEGLLESMIRTDLRGTFFSLSPERTRNTLKKLPWVRDVVVKRRWPMGLELAVTEYEAMGYWGENDLVSHDGIVFRAGSRAPMPRFDGPEDSAGKVLEHYRTAKLMLAPLGLNIASMQMSARGAVSIVTDNQLRLEFGRDQFAERLSRFTTLYQSWPPEYRAAVSRVDMRYKAAVAVAVKPIAAAAGGASSVKETS